MSELRPVYLVIYHSPLFAAHWSLFLPYPKPIPSEPLSSIAKIIHVTGNASEGFTHEFKRNYNILEDSRSHTALLLCSIPKEQFVDLPPAIGEDVEEFTDAVPLDKIEELALSIEAPGPSLKRTWSKKSHEDWIKGTKPRVELKNCQTWMRELVTVLVERGIFAEEAMSIVDNAPRN